MITRRAFLAISSLIMLGSRSAAAARPKDETVIGLLREPLTLDPRKALDTYSRTIISQVYESVLRREWQTAKMNVIPGVAESCQPDLNHPTTWELKIRSNIFQNGDPLEAPAVAYSIQQSAPRWVPDIVLDEIKVLDPYLLRISTRTPDGRLPSRLCDLYVVPPGYYSSNESDLTTMLYQRPIGSGEYVLANYVHQSHIVLERFEGYTGKKPIPRKLIYRIIPDKGAQIVAKRNGEIDITDDPPNLEFFEGLKGAGIKTVEGLGPIVFVGFNAQKLPDPTVRVALSLVLDRNAIAAQQGGTVSDSIFASEALPSPKEPVRWHNKDIPQASSLLKQAGFDRELTVAAYSDLSATAEAVVSQWKEVGIKAKTESLEIAQFRERLVNKRLPEAYVIRESTQLWEPDFVLSRYVASHGQFSTFGSPEADRLILEGRSEVLTERRAEAYQRLLGLLKRDPPFIPLYRERRFYGVSEGVIWTPRPDGQILGRDIEVR